jgi:general secretion pathway protein J
VVVRPLLQWQIFFYRGGAWTNPLSSEGTPTTTKVDNLTTAGTSSAPDGIRLSLDLPAGQSLRGKINLDWVKPTLTGQAQ